MHSNTPIPSLFFNLKFKKMRKYIKAIFIILIVAMLGSCTSGDGVKKAKEPSFPKYELSDFSGTPKTLQKERREWVLKAVEAASLDHTGGDDADMDDVISQASRTSYYLFESTAKVLFIDPSGGDGDAIKVQQVDMDSLQLEIFKRLLTGQVSHIVYDIKNKKILCFPKSSRQD